MSDLTPGTRIRISAPSYFAQPDVGELKTVARDTLIYLDALYAERLVPLGDVRRRYPSAIHALTPTAPRSLRPGC